MPQVSGVQVQFSGNAQPLESAVDRANASLDRFQKTASNVVPGNFGSKVQNASYQIQDFAVQVASGTSASRALSQQLPQLLSGFGVLGAVIGTVAAIAVPLAGAFIANGEAAGRLGEALSTVAPYALTATAALAGFYAPSLLAGLATTTSAIGVGLVGAIRAVTAAMLANPMGILVAGVAAAAVAIFAFRDDIRQVIGIDFVGIIKTSVDWTIGTFVKMSKVISVVWGSIGDIVGNALVSVANMAIGKVVSLVNKAVDAINYLIEQANRLPGVMISSFKSLDPKNFQLANSFGPGAATAGAKLGKILAEETGKGYVDGMIATASSAMSKVQAALGGLFSGESDAAKDKKDKKGPAPDVSPSQEEGRYFVDRLKALQDHFKTEMELKQQQYEEDQNVLDNALANRRISEEEYHRLSEKLEQEHQDNLANIRRSAFNVQVNAAADLFGSLAQLTDGGNKKLMKLSKAFAIAQVVINTAQGISKAFAQFGWPAGIGPAAAIAAAGAVQLANIASAESGKIKGGGGGGGGGGKGNKSSGGGDSGPAAQGPTTTFQFTLMNDPMGFGEKFARQFIDQLNSTQRNGGQIRGVIA